MRLRINTMQVSNLPVDSGARGGRKAFTLVEVLMCIAFTTILFSGIILSYNHSSYRAEWSGYSLAAQAQAIQQLEQARSAVWGIYPAKDEIANVPMTNVVVKLDVPITGNNYVYATNYLTRRIITNSTTPLVLIYFLKVDCVWSMTRGGTKVVYTNTVGVYYGPDQ